MGFEIETIVSDKRKELEAAFHAINQSRTNFQLENFVVGQHDTPTRQFQQCIMELQVKTFNLRRQMIEKRKLLKKIDTETDPDEKELLLISMEELELGLESQVREWNTLYAIFQSMPKFTYEEIQAGEEEYWGLRLARQAGEDVLAHGRIGIGNLDAMWQAKQIDHPGIKFIEENQKKQLEASDKKELQP